MGRLYPTNTWGGGGCIRRTHGVEVAASDEHMGWRWLHPANTWGGGGCIRRTHGVEVAASGIWKKK
eukprot:gene23010-biopygen8373